MIKAKIINFINDTSHIYNSCYACKSALVEAERKYKSPFIFFCEKCNAIRTGINYAYRIKIRVTQVEDEEDINKVNETLLLKTQIKS